MTKCKKMGSTLHVQSMILFEMATCSSMCQHTLCIGEASSAAGKWGLAQSCFVTCLSALTSEGASGGDQLPGYCPLGEEVGTPSNTHTHTLIKAFGDFGVSIEINQSVFAAPLFCQVPNRTGNFQSVWVQIIPAPIIGGRVTWWTYLNFSAKGHLIEIPEFWWQVF